MMMKKNNIEKFIYKMEEVCCKWKEIIIWIKRIHLK